MDPVQGADVPNGLYDLRSRSHQGRCQEETQQQKPAYRRPAQVPDAETGQAEKKAESRKLQHGRIQPVEPCQPQIGPGHGLHSQGLNPEFPDNTDRLGPKRRSPGQPHQERQTKRGDPVEREPPGVEGRILREPMAAARHPAPSQYRERERHGEERTTGVVGIGRAGEAYGQAKPEPACRVHGLPSQQVHHADQGAAHPEREQGVHARLLPDFHLHGRQRQQQGRHKRGAAAAELHDHDVVDRHGQGARQHGRHAQSRQGCPQESRPDVQNLVVEGRVHVPPPQERPQVGR